MSCWVKAPRPASRRPQRPGSLTLGLLQVSRLWPFPPPPWFPSEGISCCLHLPPPVSLGQLCSAPQPSCEALLVECLMHSAFLLGGTDAAGRPSARADGHSGLSEGGVGMGRRTPTGRWPCLRRLASSPARGEASLRPRAPCRPPAPGRRGAAAQPPQLLPKGRSVDRVTAVQR